jgi:hypothetical protein
LLRFALTVTVAGGWLGTNDPKGRVMTTSCQVKGEYSPGGWAGQVMVCPVSGWVTVEPAGQFRTLVVTGKPK